MVLYVKYFFPKNPIEHVTWTIFTTYDMDVFSYSK
jgi:hypothetical protein